VGNLTEVAIALEGLCHMPQVYVVFKGLPLALVCMMIGADYCSGVYLRAADNLPLFLGHIFRTKGVWHTMPPFPVTLRQLKDEYPLMERPHLEWKWAVEKLQADLADKLMTTRTPYFYPIDELRRRERSAMALQGLRLVQARCLVGTPGQHLSELSKLTQLTQEEQWALALNSRP